MELIHCPFCGTFLPDHLRFCSFCGNVIPNSQIQWPQAQPNLDMTHSIHENVDTINTAPFPTYSNQTMNYPMPPTRREEEGNEDDFLPLIPPEAQFPSPE